MKEKEGIPVSLKEGLTQEQVEDRIRQGKCNKMPERSTKSTGDILKDNICTRFNLYNVLIALALAFVGAWSNMVFFLIIVSNALIGIIQEFRAKKLIEGLSILSAPVAEVIRDGQAKQMPADGLVLDDIMVLKSGMQICADAKVESGRVEVNEALLTGESDAVLKQPGDMLMSGSSVISGQCQASVTHVGEDSYVANLTKEAGKLKKVHSELLDSMAKVTRFTGYLIPPLGVILFIQAFFFRDSGNFISVTTTAAALLGMLPKGLVLLISISLAAGAVALSKKMVLVQELFALETLSHVDVLCLDKTGTITQGRMKVKYMKELEQTELPFMDLLGGFVQASEDNNATFQSLKEYVTPNTLAPVIEKIPFSSERKWSAITFDQIGTLVVGAPERLTKEIPAEAKEEMEEGNRVLLVGITKEEVGLKQPLPRLQILGMICVTDPIRENASETLEFFKEQGVKIKVISGDNPATVAAVAKKAGLLENGTYIDMSTVQTEEEIKQAARTCSVFGRVSPIQKKQLVQALKKEGHTVAMTGDGVNDLMALKEADLSIAMGDGSDAARQISRLVLINSDFGVLPDVMKEGRRVVNNVTRTAGIFFIKTIYSIILSVICILGNYPFPLVPIQITLIDLAIEGYPSFIMSFQPDHRKVPGHFLREVISRALPNALSIVACFLIIRLLAPSFGLTGGQEAILQYLMIGTVSIEAVFKACLPYDAVRTFVFATMTAGYYGAVLIFHEIIKAELPTKETWLLFFCIAAISIIFERLFSFCISVKKKMGQKERAVNIS
ncbi:cation-translocating P-type ATPase [Clostridium sp. HBUAS56010]|uniref:cation-translocating P-type ATPase n=1 Tax=Clostridium sp. HBUAS56010 TaxID=2571127 RepID=UPI001177792A|nr:cation-translocating P-type ATPase [Clostridium sp. HBUAS56010]